jgi:hypothetical protein
VTTTTVATATAPVATPSPVDIPALPTQGAILREADRPVIPAPANAGCQGGWTPWGGGTTCDGPIAGDGTFQRCVTAGAMGFGGTNCYLLNVNNLAGQVPYVGP